MSIFSDQDIQLTKERATRNIAQFKPTGFMENMSAAWNEFNNNDAYGSLRAQRRKAWDDRIKDVQRLTGKKIDTPWSSLGDDNLIGSTLFGSARDLGFDPDALEKSAPRDLATKFDKAVMPHMPDTLSGIVGRLFDGVDNNLTEPQRLRKHEEELNRLRASLPPERRAAIPTRDEIEKAIKERAAKLESDSMDIGGRSTTGGFFGRLTGAGGASIMQPEVLVTLPIGAPIRAGILSRVLIEAGIGAVTEAAIQPGVQSQRAELGLESGLGRAIENIASAGVGAAGLTAAGIGVVGALKLVSKGGVEVFEKMIGRKATAEERALVHQHQRDADVEAQSPYEEKTAASYRVQQQNEQAGYEAALEGRALGEGDIVNDPSLTRKAIEDDGLAIQTLRNKDLGDIGVDAELMQFKSGGDAAGVTDRLKGVTEWVPERAGISMIYEFEDGSRIIADGHQRLGLAKRLASEGRDIEMPVHILREIDGITPADARARAAFKNIAEGTGSSKEAAKVLRNMGATADDLNLPPRSALVRDAEGLTKLDDETFGMVINDVLSEQFGAIIGRLVDDPRLQPEIARLLVRLKPANAAEADSIVRQARAAGVTRETQTSLFGDDEVIQSLYLEKARVLNRGMKMIRRNIDTFKTLNERGSDIATEGNILNDASNARRLETERMLKEYLQKQAHRKGPIGDALTEAARKAKETGQYAGPAREFVQAITRAVESGKIDGNAISGGRIDPQHQRPAAQVGRQDSDFEQVDDKTIQMFDEPNGKAAEDQALAVHREIADQSKIGEISMRVDAEATGDHSEVIVYNVFEDGKQIANIEIAQKGEGLKIENIYESETTFHSGSYGVLGPRKVMAIGRHLAAKFPDKKTISGLRTGGARHGGKNVEGIEGVAASISLDRFRKTKSEPGADGKPQQLLEGVRPVTDADRIKVASERPLRGGNEDVGGLFGDSMDQSDLMDFAVPMGEKIDADGNRVAQTQTIRDVMADLEDDQEFWEQLKLCDGGGQS